MTSKDNEFLHTRLKQLKASVLSNKGSEYNAPINPSTNMSNSNLRTNYLNEYESNGNLSSSKQRFGLAYTPLKQISVNGPYTSNTSSKVIRMGGVDLTHTESSKQVLENLTPTRFHPSTDTKRAHSYQITHGNRTRILGSPIHQTEKLGNPVLPFQPDENSNINLIPKSKIMTKPIAEDSGRVMERVIQTLNINTNRLGSGREIPPHQDLVQDVYSLNSPHLLQSPKPADSNELEMHPISNEVLRSLNQSNFLIKHEEVLIKELSAKLNSELNKNAACHNELMSLRHIYEENRRKIMELDGQLRQEQAHINQKDKEGHQRVEGLENYQNELTMRERESESRQIKLRGDLDATNKEAELLRIELKRLAEVTSEKILDLENNINAIVRMKELEKETFDMEKDKIMNSADFVIEQMRVHFNDRSTRIDDQIRGILSQKDKTSIELRTIGEELRIFNMNADQRIHNELNIVIQEETERHNKEMREIESRIRSEEEEVARINRKNQEILSHIQNTDREAKSRLLTRKNENTKLKDDLSSLDTIYNKLLIQISQEAKEVEKRQEYVESMKGELGDIKEKANMMQGGYAEEVEELSFAQEDTLKELEKTYNTLLDQEKQLIKKIRQQSEEIFQAQKKHAEAIEMVQTSVNQTLNSQFKKLNVSKRGSN